MMLVGAFVGFSRTFYLRAYLQTHDIVTGDRLPWHLHLHGAVMSAWFVLMAVQSLLIRHRRIVIHRRVGAFAVVLAGMVMCVGLLAIFKYIPRANVAHLDPPTTARIVVDDLLEIVVTFPALVVAGVSLRRRPEFHRRLMWLSCVTLWPPVLARYFSTLAVLGWPVWPALALTPFTWLAALVIHDVSRLRRVHAATAWGGLVSVMPIVIGPALSQTHAGQAFVQWLGLRM
jgi:hypothetical protein